MTKGDTGNLREGRPFGGTQSHPGGGDFAIKRCTVRFHNSSQPPPQMSTNSTSSNSEQIISEQLMAMLETRAQKAFPGAAQSGLRRECLSVLLAIAQGSSVTNNQLDSFLARDNHERICAVADCGQRFKRRDRSRDHIRVHLDYRPYGCDGRCGKPGW